MPLTTSHIPDSEERKLPEFSLMQAVKRRFFAMRNGDLASQMNVGGVKYKMNFGLNMPQISEIAEALRNGTLDGVDRVPSPSELTETARLLWGNTTTRESLLLAPMLLDASELSATDAAKMMGECPTAEVADVLCHKLLRHHAEAADIARALLTSHNATGMERYAALRLILNLVMLRRFPTTEAETLARSIANNEENSSQISTPTEAILSKSIHRLALRIIEEAEFLQ